MSSRNPFPGLRPFRDDEEHLFFGRENQVNTMVDKLAATRFLAVVGTSGSGKSSLVNCGLRPALHRGLMAKAGTAWRIAQFRPGSNPIRAMAQVLAQDGVLFTHFEPEGMTLAEVVEANLQMSKLGLADLYEQAALDANLLVVVDQFEELFRYGATGIAPTGDQSAIALVNLLLEAAAANPRIYVVLTMRSDFLGDCSRLPGLPEAINRGQYLVPRLTRDETREAIRGPVGVAGARIAPVLLTRLLNDVGDNPDQLSILQHALNRTFAHWERNGGNGPIDLADYEAIGTMSHALDQHAEECYAAAGGPRQQEICVCIFKALTDKGSDPRGVRRPTRLATLCALSEAPEAEMKCIIEIFRDPSRSFLMPPNTEPLTPDSIIDISHESLMRVWTRCRQWVDEEAEWAARYRRLAQNAELFGHGAAGLLTDPELSLMLKWVEHTRPNAAWSERYGSPWERSRIFLEQSRLARDAAVLAEDYRRKQELRRARLFALVVGLGFLLSLALGVMAFVARQQARRETTLVMAGQLAAKALLKRDSQLDLASLLAVEATRIADTNQTRHALELTFVYNPTLMTYLHQIGSIYGVAFSSDGKLLASGGDDATIRFWDPHTRQPAGQPLRGHTASVYGVAFSHDGKLLASTGDDSTVRIWNVATRQAIGAPMTGHTRAGGSVAFSPDDKILASGGYDKTIRLWSVATHEAIGTLLGHEGLVRSISFNNDGRLLASSSEDQTVRIWDVTKARPDGPFFKLPGGEIEAVSFSPDSRILAAGVADTIQFLDVATRQLIGTPLTGHTAPVHTVAFSPDGRVLASGSDASIRLWDVVNRIAIGEPLKGHTNPVWSLAFSPDGHVLASASSDNIGMWDVADKQPLPPPLQGHNGAVNSVTVSPDGHWLASGSRDQTVLIWNLGVQPPVSQLLQSGRSAVHSVSFSPDGKILVSGTEDGKIRLWDVAAHTVLGGEFDQTHAISSLAFSPDGKILACATDDPDIWLWDPDTHKPLGAPLKGHTNSVYQVVFSPDGKTLASAGGDNTVRLWDMTTRKQIGDALTGYRHPVWSVAFTPDGRLLAAASSDTVDIWDLATRQRIGEPLRGRGELVASIAFSPDGKTLAAASGNVVTLWDVASRQPLGEPILGHTGMIYSVAFSPDGNQLISASNDKTVRIWEAVKGHRAKEKHPSARPCILANRNLSMAEWRDYMGENVPYHKTCPNLPPGEGAPSN